MLHDKRLSTLTLAVSLLIASLARTGPLADTDPAAGPGEPEEPPARSTITGTVTTMHSKKPIVGAQVEIVGQNRVARTDATGRFSLGGLPAGTYLCPPSRNSSFVNFCVEYWQRVHAAKTIIYRFNPLRYEDRSNLQERFVDGLVRAIQTHTYVPELRPLVSKYSRLVGGKGLFSLYGLGLEVFPGTYTIDDALEDLDAVLARLGKKVVVVVDDLDRLSFSAIRTVLFAIKKGFTLPNISYVLCYDTENIFALEEARPEAEKVSEFLEKFVNVKYSLFLGPDILSKYVSENFDRALASNLQQDPYSRDQMKSAISAVRDIYGAQDYHRYQRFLGDIRKLKRLINTLVLLEVEKTDFENSDFNKRDLIHLVLIYINYPSVFRTIYNTETNGKRGFFSLLTPYDDGYPEELKKRSLGADPAKSTFENSAAYGEFVKTLNGNQRFLLDEVFSASRLEHREITSVPEEQRKSLACFNGDLFASTGRNLEEYLNLIVRLSKPERVGQYRFYVNAKQLIQDGTPIEKVLEAKEFAYEKGEAARQQLWRVLVNSARDFTSHTGGELIRYVLEHIAEYSLFKDEKIGLGLRGDLSLYLLGLLDRVGWSDEEGTHVNNTEENVAEIAEWIFGEKRHRGVGVLETLSAQARGPLGLYDLMSFRLYCSADRGGDFFNLQRALSKHGNADAPTQGPVQDIAVHEMRIISQQVYAIFHGQYVATQKNLFEYVEGLSVDDLTGKYGQYLRKQVEAGLLDQVGVNRSVVALKARIKAFTTYQLANKMISHGVGCGYYDVQGRGDRHGIAGEMNEYLFEVCFNPRRGESNYEHFLDYLLMTFRQVLARESRARFRPEISEFTKVLDERRLAEYWEEHGGEIKKQGLSRKEKVVMVTDSHAVSYEKDLEAVYALLDELVAKVSGEGRDEEK